jgi:hypothetical protein
VGGFANDKTEKGIRAPLSPPFCTRYGHSIPHSSCLTPTHVTRQKNAQRLFFFLGPHSQDSGSTTMGFFVDREEGVYRYAHWLANYPSIVLTVTLAISAILIAIAFRQPFKLDSGGAGFVPRTDPLGIRKDSLLAAIDYSYFSPVILDQLPGALVQPQQEVSGSTLGIIYEKNRETLKAEGPNILTDAAIDEMRSFEEGLRARANFADYCLKRGGQCTQPLSLQNFFWPPGGRGTVKTSNATSDVLNAIPSTVLAQLVDKDYRYPNNVASNYSQALFTFGVPLAGYNNSQSDRAAQDAAYNKWILAQRKWLNDWNKQSLYVDLLWLGEGITQADTDDLLLGDARWAILAILFVIVYMIIHMMSWWMGLWAMFQIILSFPVAYFFVRIAMRVAAFNTLNMLGVFIVIGIGADDAFIFSDRWKQSAFQEGCTTHSKRMAWTFYHAARPMFTTSITTAVAFFINASSSIAPIRVFGVFSGLLVTINYIYVITLFPCFVSLWGRYMENKCLDGLIKAKTGRPNHDLASNEPKADSSQPYSAAAASLSERATVKKMRLIERFFYFKYYRFIM